MNIGEKISLFRKKKNISQRELGRRINKTGQYISYIELSDQDNVTVSLLNDIAKALEVDIKDFFEHEHSLKSNTKDSLKAFSNDELLEEIQRRLNKRK